MVVVWYSIQLELPNWMSEGSQKMEGLILELNKSGLSYLVNNQFPEAIEYLKKAEKSITEELKIEPKNQKINQIAGITFNNLACYYKKNKKPKVALGYLKKALELEVYRVEDWVSTASTHINICAIYSYLGKHQQSAEHAELALTMLEKVDPSNLKEAEEDGEKSYWNIKMLSHYNLAIELQYLKKYPQSRKQYEAAKETALQNKKKNENILNVISQSLERIQQAEKSQKTKILSLLANRRMQEEKGYSQFMRKNKKHYGQDAEWKSIVQNRKYQIYKTDHNDRRQYQSTEKVKRLAPLNGSHSKRGLQT